MAMPAPSQEPKTFNATLAKWGNSQGIRISKEVCEVLHIAPGSTACVSADPVRRTLTLAFNEGFLLDHESILAAVRRTLAEWPQVERAWLFGSRARGDALPESDIDLRLHINYDLGFSLYDVAYLTKALERATGHDVDIVTARELKNKSLEAAIERDKVFIYERESE